MRNFVKTLVKGIKDYFDSLHLDGYGFCALISALVLIVSGCFLDSRSLLPFLLTVLATGGLGLFSYLAGWDNAYGKEWEQEWYQDNPEKERHARKVIINATICKSASMEVELSDEGYAALQTDAIADVIGNYLDQAFEKADRKHNNVDYDYQLVDAETHTILIDWDR